MKNNLLKFIYPEKATKFCEISTIDLSYVVPVKSTVEILQNFVAFSEYMNYKSQCYDCRLLSVCPSYVVPVKSKVEILQNFVAFSEYMNFMKDFMKDFILEFWIMYAHDFAF